MFPAFAVQDGQRRRLGRSRRAPRRGRGACAETSGRTRTAAGALEPTRHRKMVI